MKIRITNLDYNLFKPINYFDDNLSSFSDLPLANSPILRVFGRLDTGQMACAHVHGVYPYFYIEYKHCVTPEKVRDYIHQLGLSINQSLSLSLRRNMNDKQSTTQFLRAIVICKGTPFYGYNVGTRPFLKIIMNDPKHIPRLVQLMESGQLMNTTFQAYESHAPYLLQFFTDYNLYGCDWMQVSQAKFRLPLPDPPITDWDNESAQDSTVNSFSINEGDTHTVPRDTNCLVEFDIRASWIENRYQIAPRYIHNTSIEELVPDDKLLPSLRELWVNEEKRREAAGLESSIKIQGSVKGGRNDSKTYPRWDALEEILDSFHERIIDQDKDDDFLSHFTEEHKLMTIFESTEALYRPSERRKVPQNEDSSLYLDISSSQPNKDIEPIVSQQLASQKTEFMEMDIDDMAYDSFAQNNVFNGVPRRDLAIRESTVLSENRESIRQLSLMDSLFKSSTDPPLKREPTLEVIPDSQESEEPERKRSRSDSSELLASQEYDAILASLSQREIMPGVTIGMVQEKIEKASPQKDVVLSGQLTTIPHRSQPHESDCGVLYEYKIPPPTTDEAMRSFRDNTLPSKVYRDPYYSEPTDVPERPREYAGRVFVLKGDEIPSWDAKYDTVSTQGIRHFEYAPLPPSKRDVISAYGREAASTQRAIHTQIEGPPSRQKFGLDASTASGEKNHIPREHDIQTQITMMIVEVFAKNIGNKVPNPEHNPVEAIFWAFQSSDDEVESGMVVVEGETKYKLNETNMEIAINEADLIFTLIDKVQEFDPDILAGWDTELGSWGYLVDRARIEIGLELSEETSRVKSRTMRNITGGQKWAEMKTTTFTSPGRHVFNVWRLARSELSLPQTTFEHVSHSVLKKR
ncbi:hypothetical protein E3Q03_01809 [Wallemia mellicola]|uniref:DNA-directed DNA polymerase family B exonuclease domain-containing protein n=1 Tax=Wallemia mellicola TaxID=1708541 RepID=A0AB74KF15_9BASI|nr:hypothetical protein E3Q03_01809 [Wallemia mellicola]